MNHKMRSKKMMKDSRLLFCLRGTTLKREWILLFLNIMSQNRTLFSGILFYYPNLSSFSRRKTKLRFKVKNEMNLYFLSLVSSGQSTRRENKNSEDVWVNINNSNRRYFLAYDSSFTFIGTEFMVDIRKRKNENFCTFSL